MAYNGKIIWRYMDFTKFMSMLDTGGLWFSRIDKLGDPYEFTVPKGFYEAREKWRDEVQKKIMTWRKEEPDGFMANYIEWETERYTGFSQPIPIDRINQLKKLFYISCWHNSSHESDAMWKIYLKSDEGIAVSTNMELLSEQLRSHTAFQGVRKVRYLDFQRRSVHRTRLGHLPLMKRSAFQHEMKFGQYSATWARKQLCFKSCRRACRRTKPILYLVYL